MVRLLIPLVAIFLVWLLFFSPFSKKLRLGLSAAVIVATVFGLWIDTNGRSVKTNRVVPNEVVTCGISGEYSYRTNYNVTVCLQNNADRASVQRLRVRFDVLACEGGDCETLDASEETFSVAIAPKTHVEHVANVSFDKLPANMEGPIFSATVLEVWASR